MKNIFFIVLFICFSGTGVFAGDLTKSEFKEEGVEIYVESIQAMLSCFKPVDEEFYVIDDMSFLKDRRCGYHLIDGKFKRTEYNTQTGESHIQLGFLTEDDFENKKIVIGLPDNSDFKFNAIIEKISLKNDELSVYYKSVGPIYMAINFQPVILVKAPKSVKNVYFIENSGKIPFLKKHKKALDYDKNKAKINDGI